MIVGLIYEKSKYVEKYSEIYYKISAIVKYLETQFYKSILMKTPYLIYYLYNMGLYLPHFLQTLLPLYNKRSVLLYKR